MRMKLKHYFLAGSLMFSLSACAEQQSEGFSEYERSINEGPVQTFLDGCKKELETYCKDVTPGEGRILACIYAHGDKLSGRCEYAMYESAAQLERIMEALSYVINECYEDLHKFCDDVTPGEGRLLSCLNKHEKEIGSACNQALVDVGLKK